MKWLPRSTVVSWLRMAVAGICVGIFHTPILIALPAPQLASEDDELSDEEARQIKTADRFFDVLLKNPRYGTALDRVYGHHVEFGSLDKFLMSLKERAENEAEPSAAWMLLGMFESQRGNDASAVEALTKADELHPDDALASYYLGQAQLRIGQSNEAIVSFERAIERMPARADLLEIFQTLGRMHQRAQRTEQAMEVWQRLERLFPDDPRVLEQIAVTLAEEGQPALALPRYEKLATLVRDDYRRVVYRMTAAELTIKTGKRDAGLQALEKVLEDLNPESWLYRDVRRRIDDVFLRSGDQDSLVKYYQNWLVNHPEDVEGMARLAKFLASTARVPEATEWMEKALKLAPTRAELRKSFIDQLVNDQRFPEAIAQYEHLLKAAPGNADYLRDWGKLVLRNREVPEAQRQQEAGRIWNQILANRPDDALTVSQVADLFRQNKILEQAEKLYRRAVELAPDEPQYREYLGEFLHIQGRSEEALSVWANIAEGARRNAVNTSRLAEVYNSFGFAEKAILEIAEAVKLEPKDFSLHIRAADYNVKANQYDQAMSFVESASGLAANDDERDAVIQQRIEVLQVSQQLDKVADEQLARLQEATDASAHDWYLAARYLEAGRRWPDATEAVDNAIKIDPKSIPAMTLAARIAESSGDYGRAAQMSRTLAEIDRRARGDHLMNVSRLESQLGRFEEALKAAQELIVSAPGNTDNYEFYAQTCFRFGKNDEGLDALRKAVRINPNEPHLIMALAAALADQLRTDEALEVYWRAFEKTDDVEDKVSLTMKLTPLYQQINQMDKLIERLERDRREEDKRREMTLCLAQAWHTSGDLGAARQELEGLLSEDTRDTNLLNQLAKLCEAAADLDAAVGYQRQLVAIAPGHETEFPLAKMLMASGQMDEARDIFVKLTQREEDPVRQIRALDSLITQGNFESAIGVIEPILAQNRDDWELLYREGVAWAELEKNDEAVNRFQRILALTLPYDSLGRSAAEKLKQDQAKAKSANLRGIATNVPQRQSPLAMRSMSSQVQQATGLIADNRYYGSGQTPPIWTPDAYGTARMAALGWLMKFEEDRAQTAALSSDNNNPSTTTSTEEADPPRALETSPPATSIVDKVRETAEQENASREAIYDWLYVAQLKNDFAAIFEIARQMAKTGGKEEQQFYLTSLKLRHAEVNQAAQSSSAPAANQTPLTPDDLQLAQDCYEQLADQNKSVDFESIYGGNVAFGSNGQVYVLVGSSYSPLPGVFRGQGGYLNVLVEELRLAGRTEEALKLLNEQLADAKTAVELAGAMSLLFAEERFDELPDMLERWEQAALKQIAEAPVTAPARGAPRTGAASSSANVLPTAQNTLQRWIGKLGEEEEHALVLSILDRCLNVAEAEARHRRMVQAAQTRRTATALPSSTGVGSVAIFFGKQQSQANLNFPPLNNWMDRSSCTLLYQVHDVLKRNDVGSDLADLLRKRAAEVSANGNDTDQMMCNHLYLAASLWWAEEQDEAVEQMAKAAELVADDLSLQFSLATMYETRGDFDEAVSLMEKILPRDQKVLQAVELRVLQLAERLGDTERARTAAERLFGLRLDSQTQLGLVDRMRRLGLGAMADAVLARAERTATNQTSSLASLMMLYQGQGKTEQANQLAHILLRKTTSPINIVNKAGRNPARYRTQDSTLRTQALQLLQRSGELKQLIDQLESQLKRAPDSIPALQQLIEFYGQTNQRDETKRIIEQGLGVRPDSPMLRLQMAKLLEQSGKTSEACDQYLELLKLKPDWVTDELYQIDRVFAQAKRKADLVKGLSQINLKQTSQPYYIFQTAADLLESEETIEAGMSLMERAFEAFPSYRQNMLRNTRNQAIWQNERFYEFAKRSVLPSPLEIRTNPWTGLDQINSYSGNGEVNVFFHQMLKGLKTTDKLGDLERSIQELLKQQPKWHGGHAMLALLEFEFDRKKEAVDRLKSLLSDETIAKSMPVESCWIIGQELDRFEDTRQMAMSLFEQAMSAPDNNSMSQLQYSPIVKLIDNYSRAGRAEEAKNILLKQLAGATFDQYDQEYSSYQRIENSTWAAQRLIQMEFPVEAMKLYQGLLGKQDQLVAAAQWNGRQTNYYENLVNQGLSTAVKSVQDKNADEVISQLLSVPDNLKPGNAAIDLMVSFPDAQNLTTVRMRSSYVELFKSMSTDANTAKRISARLAELAEQHPQDISIAVVLAVWYLETEPDNAADAVRRLVALTSDQPLEAIPEGRRANSRQRREASLYLPLWLVARQCLAQEQLFQDGMILAELSQAAAMRQLGIKESSAILYDWGKTLIEAGRKDDAAARWTELLDLATQRPGGRKPVASPKASLQRTTVSPLLWSLSPLHFPQGLIAVLQPPQPVRAGTLQSAAQVPRSVGQEPAQNPGERTVAQQTPPLTVSQFRTVIAVAQAAAENGLQELSRRAVVESLSGGFPVADPVATDVNASQSMIIRSSSSTSSATDTFESEVVRSLEKVLAIWMEREFSTQETYNVLRSLVLPTSHPQEIRMYVTASNLSAAEIKCLAEALIAVAEKADKLDELKDAIAERQQHPAAQVSASAMNVLIDLKRNSLEQTAESLDACVGNSLSDLSSQDRIPAFLAALRAFDKPELKAKAFPVLQSILQLEVQSRSAQGSEVDVSGKLASLVNRYLAESGDEKAIVDYFEQIMTSRQAYYSRYGGDYGMYMQQNDLVKLGQQASVLGMTSAALDYLGRAVDFEVTQYGSIGFGTPLSIVIRQFRSLPAEERYAKWLEWTLPTEGRQTLRAVHEATVPTNVPQAFASKSHPYETQLRDGLLSNFLELVDAAKHAKRLDDLKALVEPLAASKEKSADILLALVLIAQENAEVGVPHIKSVQSSFIERMKAESTRDANNRVRQPSSIADYLVYRACLQSPTFVSLYEDHLPNFRSQMQKYPSSALQRVNLDWSTRVSAPATTDTDLLGNSLAHWIPSHDHQTSGVPQAWWAAYQDQVVALNGLGGGNLFYRYPISGDNFAISFDCFAGSWTGGNAGFGGVLINAFNSGNYLNIRSLAGHEDLTRRVNVGRAGLSFNTLTIESSDGTMRYIVNGQLVYQEPRKTTSPWLVLNTDGMRFTAFRNLQISGDVIVPDSVSLVNADQMDGWRSDGFGESQPRKRLMQEVPADENDSVAYYQREEPSAYDWSAADGILKGRGDASASSSQQSWIYYQRPLLAGESLEYEFFFSPGKSVAHPSIGQLALMLEPEGVVSHWIATVQDLELHGIAHDNAVVEADIRRGPQELPLKPDDWNRVQLELRGDTAVVTLNGTIVCERPLEAELDRRFGIFRYKHQSSQIRNIVLSGNWPERLPEGAEKFELDQPSSPASVRSVAKIVDDLTIAPLAGEVVATARSMDAEAAYDYLLDWVLPSATHDNIRLHYSQVPPQPVTGSPIDRNQGFDQIVSPSVELVRMAVQLNKTEVLAKAIDSWSRGSVAHHRACRALGALLALEANNEQTIETALGDVWTAVNQPYPSGASSTERIPEFLVAWRAAQHPKYWSIGSDIARKLRDYERNEETASADNNFKRQIHTLVGAADRRARMTTSVVAEGDSVAAEGESTPLSQWSSVPYLKPEHRWAGYQPSTWTVAKGSAQHLPADTWSQLFFQSPLQGDFEIVADRTTHGYKEVSIAWGMHSAEPLYDLKGLRVTKLMHSSNDIRKEIQLPVWDQQAEFRIVVAGRKVTTWTNGVQVHEQIFDRAPDPWLLLHSSEAANYARVSNLRILGSPEIPAEIDMINVAGLAGWRADVYNEWFRTEEDADDDQSVPWRRIGDELHGVLSKNMRGDDRQSLIMYQRPMLEDGEIEFESWYEPGVTEVHPALGRHAYLLTPEGVMLHRLTDAQYEIAGLSASNREMLPNAAKSLALKPKDWNQVRLSLRGDQLTITVNGAEAATATVTEKPNFRQFGLFRYSNLTRSRVRKLIYRGQWPKELPPLESQDLAASTDGPHIPAAQQFIDADLSLPERELENLPLALRGPADRRQTSGEGLELHLHDTKDWTDSPGISYTQPIEGDCEVTVAYQGIQMSRPKTGWGVSLVFELVLDDFQKSRVECNVSLNDRKQLQHTTQVMRNHAAGSSHAVDQQVVHPGNASGNLRMIRRGGQVDCYVAPAGSNEFKLVNSLAVGGARILSVACGAKCSDDAAKLDVTLTRLTIRGEKEAAR